MFGRTAPSITEGLESPRWGPASAVHQRPEAQGWVTAPFVFVLPVAAMVWAPSPFCCLVVLLEESPWEPWDSGKRLIASPHLKDKASKGRDPLWLIHVEIWQRTTKFCKAIILQLNNNNKKRQSQYFIPSVTILMLLAGPWLWDLVAFCFCFLKY